MPSQEIDLHRQSLAERIRHAVSQSELSVALVVSEILGSEMDLEGFGLRFTDRIQSWMQDTGMTVDGLLECFRSEGFAASQVNRAQFYHSDIAWVYAEKKGIPITLAILVIEAARHFGLPAHGVNFPGHFLVRVADELVDPVAMRVLNPEEIKTGDQDLAHLLTPATPAMIGLRMLNNVKALHLNAGDLHCALEIVDYQIALDPDNVESVAALQYERGEFWQQLGAYTAARDAFNECAASSPFARLAEQARERAENLAQSDETLH